VNWSAQFAAESSTTVFDTGWQSRFFQVILFHPVAGWVAAKKDGVEESST
jgi:hypothetical protein